MEEGVQEEVSVVFCLGCAPCTVLTAAGFGCVCGFEMLVLAGTVCHFPSLGYTVMGGPRNGTPVYLNTSSYTGTSIYRLT